MGRITHRLFSLSGETTTSGEPPVTVTCTCGKAKTVDTAHAAVDWFGEHCFTAALDRAIELLRS